MPYKHLLPSPHSSSHLVSSAFSVAPRDSNIRPADKSWLSLPPMEVGTVQEPPPPPLRPPMRSFVLQDPSNTRSNRGGRLTSFWRALRGLASKSGSHQNWKAIFMGWRLVLFHSCMCFMILRRLPRLKRTRAKHVACLHPDSGQLTAGINIKLSADCFISAVGAQF